MEEDAGLHFLLKLDTSLSDEVLIEKAKQAGLHIACLSKYYDKPEKKAAHTLVMNYSGLEPEKIPEAVKRLSECLR